MYTHIDSVVVDYRAMPRHGYILLDCEWALDTEAFIP